MRVFRIDKASNHEYICGNTLIHALQVYCDEMDVSLREFCDTDDIVEIPEEKWSEISFLHDDDGEITIEQYMDQNIYPGLICENIL